MEILDSHHHLWIYKSDEYSWINNSMKVLQRDYLPGDLQTELHKTGVSGTVAVQARQTLDETRWLLELSTTHDFIKAVIGWVDLRSDDLEDRLKEFTDHPKFKGVRHVIHDEPDVDFMLQPDFLRGIGKLADYGLTYDLLLFPKHLQNAVKLVSKFPKQKFVLDHLAKPYIKAGEIEEWQNDITTLAGLPNVWCKISGMVTEADHAQWNYEDFVPYLDVVFKTFGKERLMVGSDWPVCRLAAEYEEVLNIPEKFMEGFTEEEREKLFFRNCAEAYTITI